MRVWDVRDFSAAAQTLEGHVNIPHCCDVSADGNYLISSSNGFDDGSGCEVKVWDRRAAGRTMRPPQRERRNTHHLRTHQFCRVTSVAPVMNQR